MNGIDLSLTLVNHECLEVEPLCKHVVSYQLKCLRYGGGLFVLCDKCTHRKELHVCTNHHKEKGHSLSLCLVCGIHENNTSISTITVQFYLCYSHSNLTNGRLVPFKKIFLCFGDMYEDHVLCCSVGLCGISGIGTIEEEIIWVLFHPCTYLQQ